MGRFFKTIGILLLLTILWSCEIRKFLDIPVSKEERSLFKEIEAETGFVIDSTILDRRIYIDRSSNEFCYVIEFYRDKKYDNDSVLRKEVLKFCTLLKEDPILSKLSENRNSIFIHIDFNKYKEQTKGMEITSSYFSYSAEVYKDKYILYDWNKNDTIFIKK